MATSRVQVIQLPVPEQLENNPNCKLDRIFFDHGLIIARYTNNGTLIVGNHTQKALHSIPNPSPINAMALCHPHVVTVHASETVQVFNVGSKQCDQYQQERGLVEGVRTVLANSRSVVALAPRRIIAWDRDTMTTQPPRVHDMSAAPAQIASFGEHSALIGDSRVLVVNANPGGHAFQIWDFVTGELLAYAESPAKMESFLTFTAAPDGLVVGTLRDVMYIWHTAGKPGQLQPAHTVRFEKTIITALHIDPHMILAGDNYGGITLHTRTGRLVYHLTRKRSSDVDVATAQLSQLSALFRNKVNQIVRFGRWVVVALASSRVELFDIFSPSLAAPVDSYSHPATQGGVHDLTVEAGKVYALFSHSKSSAKTKPRPDFICWTPKSDYGYFDPTAEEILGAPITLAHQACSKVTPSLAKIQTSADELREHSKALNNATALLKAAEELERQQGIELPFNLLQNLVSSLDAYEIYILKLAKSGKLSSKNRDVLEDLRQSFARSAELIINCADFLGDVKARTGIAAPYSEKAPKVVSQDDLSAGGFGGAHDGGHRRGYTQRKKEQRQQQAQHQGRRGTADSESEPPSVADEDDAIEDMLGDAIDDLGYMHEQTSELVERYDAICNEGIHDPDKIMPLLSIYTKLRQLAEDLKEAAKEIGELRNDDSTGEWWEGGGEYDDVGAEPIPAPSPSVSVPAAASAPPPSAASPSDASR